MKSTDVAEMILKKRKEFKSLIGEFPEAMIVNEDFYYKLNRGWCLILENGMLFGMQVKINNSLKDYEITME